LLTKNSYRKALMPEGVSRNISIYLRRLISKGGIIIMKKSFNVFSQLAIGLAIVFGMNAYSNAQEEAGISDEFTLEEITVTAQKRVENQQKVAIAMDVISGDLLAETGKTNVNDILANISNVMINNSYDGMRVSVRGITETEAPTKDLHTSTPAVAINIDGAYNRNSNAGQNLFDIERVEVLAGPQSTLYASTSPGGIVNVVTASPKTDRFSANASIEIGSYSLRNIQFAGNAPIVKDMVAIRLATQMYKRDSFISGTDQTGDDTKSARLKTLYQPNDKFSATLTVNYTKRINGGIMGGQVQPFDYQDGHYYTQASMDGPWTKDGKVTDPWTAASTSSSTPEGMTPSGPNAGAQITKGITGELNWDVGLGNLSIVPQYSRTISDDKSNYTDDDVEWTASTKMKSYQKGVEARMTSAADFIFKWIAGANYYKSDDRRNTYYNNPEEVDTLFENMTQVKAVFANVTYPFSDRVRGTAGYRRTWDKIETIEKPSYWGTGTTGQDYSQPDYSLGVEYDLAKNSMLYANFATSYRMNGMANNVARENPIEQLKAYTVGVKNRLLQNTLQVNASAYWYDYSNKEAFVNTDGSLSSDQTVYEDDLVDINGKTIDADSDGIYGEHELIATMRGSDPWRGQYGAFRTIGVDLSAEWLATMNDRVTLAVSYLNAKWSDLTMKFYWQKASGGHFWATDGMSYNGFTNTYSPTWTITSSYEHTFALGSYGILVTQIDAKYKSDFLMDLRDINRPIAYQEPYNLFDGSVTFTHSSGKWSLNAYVKNAMNYAAKNFLVNMGGDMSLGLTDPRTYGTVLSVKF
jgi:iron complex outermembrane recepter protein